MMEWKMENGEKLGNWVMMRDCLKKRKKIYVRERGTREREKKIIGFDVTPTCTRVRYI